MKTPEGYEKDEITRFLKERGAYFIKPMTYGYGKSGAPDIVGCLAGSFVGIEVKREGKEPTALQVRRGKEIIQAGGKWFWGTAAVVIPAIETWLRKKAFGGPIAGA